MEGSWPSMWSSVRDWFSPTTLFVLLNVVIGTIALTSKKLRSHHHRDDDHHPRPISRGPSAVLDRLRSIGLYGFRSGDFTLDATALSPHSPKSELPEAPDASAGGEPQQTHFSRCQSDPQEKPGEEKDKKLAGRMKKSASENSAFALLDEAEILRRPAAARSRVRAALVVEEEEEEEEVDARADAFINRFKQQLQLQRLDSILRYKEMLNRGK
ncbi:pathogen-associated molecular patterns-induced protein A70 [Cocos nucifera]|uniref:Pathogen-associated molecular patterns-induced protein A70 n=1 Tax=Cocos nucifera TaxID=13894 RepID=A0A8K0IAJ3_COCNU|nr:pathogen-associated molecular patterns-induced protein A70 [Cocos nucifera]